MSSKCECDVMETLDLFRCLGCYACNRSLSSLLTVPWLQGCNSNPASMSELTKPFYQKMILQCHEVHMSSWAVLATTSTSQVPNGSHDLLSFYCCGAVAGEGGQGSVSIINFTRSEKIKTSEFNYVKSQISIWYQLVVHRLLIYSVKRLHSKKNASCMANILDVSTKLTPLCSPFSRPSSELNSISCCFVIEGRLFGNIIHYSTDAHYCQ